MKNTDNLMFIEKEGKFVVQKVSTKQQRFSLSKDEKVNITYLIFDDILDVYVDLKEEGADFSLNCIYLGCDNNKPKIKVSMNHQVGSTKSSQIIRGVLTHQAQGTFHGSIFMNKNAMKCEGYQNHQAVLLSDMSGVETIPELLIYADDVKCDHGSAVGAMDENQIFYLMSRGISKIEAQKILIKGFLNDLLPDCSYVEEWLEKNV